MGKNLTEANKIDFLLKFVKGSSGRKRLNFSTNSLKRPKRRQKRPFEGPSYRTVYPPNKPFLDRDTNSSLGDNGCRYVDPTEHDFKKEGNKTSKVRQYRRQTPSTRSKPEILAATTKVGLFFPGFNMINLRSQNVRNKDKD